MLLNVEKLKNSIDIFSQIETIGSTFDTIWFSPNMENNTVKLELSSSKGLAYFIQVSESKVESEERFGVSLEKIKQIIKNISNEKNVSIDYVKSEIVVSASKFTYKIPSISGTMYIKNNTDIPDDLMDISSKTIESLTSASAIVMETGISRPALGGIYFTKNGIASIKIGKAFFCNFQNESIELEDTGAIIPIFSITVANLLPKKGLKCGIHTDENNSTPRIIFVNLDGNNEVESFISIFTINYPFPYSEMNTILKSAENCNYNCKLSVDSIKDSLKRLKPFFKDEKLIKATFNFEKKQLTLSGGVASKGVGEEIIPMQGVQEDCNLIEEYIVDSETFSDNDVLKALGAKVTIQPIIFQGGMKDGVHSFKCINSNNEILLFSPIVK